MTQYSGVYIFGYSLHGASEDLIDFFLTEELATAIHNKTKRDGIHPYIGEIITEFELDVPVILGSEEFPITMDVESEIYGNVTDWIFDLSEALLDREEPSYQQYGQFLNTLKPGFFFVWETN